MSLEWCRICRNTHTFDVLPGTTDVPPFNLCRHCGFGYSIDTEEETA